MRESLRLRALALLAALAAGTALGAGTARAQAPAIPESETDPWAVAIDLALTGASGNESFVIFTTGAQVKRLATERYELELDGLARYGRSDGKDIARSVRAGARFDFAPAAAWSPFLFTQAEHDRVRSLDLRVQSGGGAKYTPWQGERGEASLSVALLHDYENQRAAPVSQTARWSWRAKGERAFGDGLRVQHTTFYQPVWNEVGDYLLIARTGLSTRVTEHIALTLSHSYERDSTPPAGVREDDQVVTVGLKLQF